MVQLPNIPEFLTVCFALFRLGALPVFSLPAHRSNEITYFCEHAEASAYIIPDVYGGFDYRELAKHVQEQVTTLQHVIVVGEPGISLWKNCTAPDLVTSRLFRRGGLSPIIWWQYGVAEADSSDT